MNDKELSDSISILTSAMCEYQEMKRHTKHGGHTKSHDRLATKQDLEKIGNQIMKYIENYTVSQSLYNDQIEASIKELTFDVESLNNLVQSGNLSGSVSGSSFLTTEDQAKLDSLVSRSLNISTVLIALNVTAGTFASSFSSSYSGSNSSGSEGSGSYPYSGSNSGSVPGEFTGSATSTTGEPFRF